MVCPFGRVESWFQHAVFPDRNFGKFLETHNRRGVMLPNCEFEASRARISKIGGLRARVEDHPFGKCIEDPPADILAIRMRATLSLPQGQ
jgi:hypothetical protein